MAIDPVDGSRHRTQRLDCVGVLRYARSNRQDEIARTYHGCVVRIDQRYRLDQVHLVRRAVRAYIDGATGLAKEGDHLRERKPLRVPRSQCRSSLWPSGLVEGRCMYDL